MKPILLLLSFTLVTLASIAQKPTITWGEDFKLKKGSTDISVVYTDKTGVYLEESHQTASAWISFNGGRGSASLVKVDRNLQELYRTDFNKELKGKEFVQFFPFRDKLLIIASEYHKRENTLDILGAEIDKNTGEITETWKPITSFQKDEKKDRIEFKLIPNADSSRIVVISTVSGKEKNSYRVQEFDQKLKPASKAAVISNEFEAKTYQLEDLLYTPEKKIILVGRVMEYQEGKKKKEKFLDFANYNIRIYNESGKQLNEINTNINGKWLTSTKLMLGKGKDLILAGFYSKEKKGKTTDGLLVQRIDPNTGNVLSTTDKAINNSLLTTDNGVTDDDKDDDKDEESKSERKEREKLAKLKDEGEGFSKYVKFRDIFYTSDGGLVLLAEHYNFYVYTTSYYSPGTNGVGGTWTYQTNYVYECGDILMVKLDASNEISWLQILPKSQREVIRSANQGGVLGLSTSYSFFDGSGRPFYAGFGTIQKDNEIRLFFNDSPKNEDVLQPGKKVSRISSYRKSDCFVVTLDGLTGKYQRKMFFSNNDVPTAMPRLGSVIGKDMYLVGKTDRTFGKSKLAIAKITTN